MVPDPDSNSKNAPTAINNLTNELIRAMHKFTNQNYLNAQVMILCTSVIGNGTQAGYFWFWMCVKSTTINNAQV